MIVDIIALKHHLGITDTRDDFTLEAIIKAVESQITSWLTAEESTTDDVKLGALMLAARLFRRRNSPSGVESLGDLGPVYVSRNDPDVAQLIGLGTHRRLRVG